MAATHHAAYSDWELQDDTNYKTLPIPMFGLRELGLQRVDRAAST